MGGKNRLMWIFLGTIVGATLVTCWNLGTRKVHAATSDRHKDFIICTGAASITNRVQTDGVWILDYRSGKLKGTVIDRARGKIIGWAEVDLVTEFGVEPRTDVHFMMVTGQINNNQAALYVAETVSGKFGVYTMGPRRDGNAGVVINRHDMVLFRQPKK